jgi:hypothetical protein
MAQKDQYFRSDGWIVQKVLQEFPEAVFLGVAMESLLSDEEVLSANETNSSKGPELLIRPLDSPHIFTDISRDRFPYCTFGIATQ